MATKEAYRAEVANHAEVICILSARDDHEATVRTICSPENAPYYAYLRPSVIDGLVNGGPDDDIYSALSRCGYEEEYCLRLQFNSSFKAGAQITFGKRADCCDVVLPPHPDISDCHFSLLYNDQNRLCLLDTSKYGTRVSYDGALIPTTKARRRYQWVLMDKEPMVTIQVSTLRFDLRLAYHVDRQAHDSRIAAFKSRPVQEHMLFSRLKVLSTKATSNAEYERVLYSIFEHPIGVGGFSEVFEAHRNDDIQVAIKKFSPTVSLSRYYKEVNLTRKISTFEHDHLDQFLDCNPISLTLIMPLAKEGSLHHVAKKLSSVQVATAVLQILDALRCLHKKGIVHQDVKPANVLVQCLEPLHIRLSDFGCSKESPSILFSGDGTSVYTAPELLHDFETDEEVVDGISFSTKVDIWATGVLFVELYLGIPREVFAIGLETPAEVERRKLLRRHFRFVPNPMLLQRHVSWFRNEHEVAKLILVHMLVIPPEDRSDAEKCHLALGKLLNKGLVTTVDPAALRMVGLFGTPSIVVTDSADLAAETSTASTADGPPVANEPSAAEPSPANGSSMSAKASTVSGKRKKTLDTLSFAIAPNAPRFYLEPLPGSSQSNDNDNMDPASIAQPRFSKEAGVSVKATGKYSPRKEGRLEGWLF